MKTGAETRHRQSRSFLLFSSSTSHVFCLLAAKGLHHSRQHGELCPLARCTCTLSAGHTQCSGKHSLGLDVGGISPSLWEKPIILLQNDDGGEWGGGGGLSVLTQGTGRWQRHAGSQWATQWLHKGYEQQQAPLPQREKTNKTTTTKIEQKTLQQQNRNNIWHKRHWLTKRQNWLTAKTPWWLT